MKSTSMHSSQNQLYTILSLMTLYRADNELRAIAADLPLPTLLKTVAAFREVWTNRLGWFGKCAPSSPG